MTKLQLGKDIALGILILVVTVGAVRGFISDARADERSKTEKLVREEAKAELEHQKQSHDQEVKDLKSQMSDVKTVPQAVKIVEVHVPAAAAAVVSKADVSPTVPLPDSPSGKFTLRGDAQEVAVAQTVTNLEVCRKDFSLCGAEKAKLQTDLDSMTRDRDSWKSAAKGGSRFKRIVNGAIKIGIGAGVGYALGRAGR